MAPLMISTSIVTILLLLSPVLLVESRRRPTCDRSLLSICYNQLQPFFLTNNLRLVLRGVIQNSQHRQPPVTIAGNKHGRSQPAPALALPLHRIYAEFREFCDLFSTFSECLDAHGAVECMEADLIGELSNVVVTVARRDRSNNAGGAGAHHQPQSPTDLIRDFDHYRRLASSYCVDTPENMRIHIVRCLAHAISSSSPTLDDHKGTMWADSHLAYVDGSPQSLIGPTAATCSRWLRQSQAPLIQSFFRQDGCGEHLSSAIRLSAFLAELTMRTTNTTDAGVSPKFNLCVRHVSPKIFESIINETFYNLLSPAPPATEEPKNTQPPQIPSPTLDEKTLSVEKLITASNVDVKSAPSFPILSVEESNRLIETPWLKVNGGNKPLKQAENVDDEDDGGEPVNKKQRQNSVVIPMTADVDEVDDESGESSSTDSVGYDDGGAVLGVQLMMADSPLGINNNRNGGGGENEPSAGANQRLSNNSSNYYLLSLLPTSLNLILSCFLSILLVHVTAF